MGKISRLFSEQRITLSLQQKTQMLTLDKEFEALESKVAVLQAEKLRLEAEVNPLKREIERLQKQIEKNGSAVHASNPSGYVCDHCGSDQLKRTGNRPDPTFHEVGVKQAVFLCVACGKQSAFTPDDI